MQLKNKFKSLNYLFKRHVYNQVVTGKIGKFFHYTKIFLKNKFFDCPRLAMIEIGTTCNLRCPTCPTPRDLIGRSPNIMKIEEYKKIIEAVKNYVHVVLLYYSNEPLLNPGLAEMIQYADKKNLYTMISTNAMLLDNKKTDEILDAGLDEILLCLDGMTKEAYEPFRIGAKFETVVKNIKYFCEEKKRRKLVKPYIELQYIVTKLNQNQIPQVKDFVKKYNIDRLRIKSLAIGEYNYREETRKELVEKFLPTHEDAKTRYKKEKGNIKHKSFSLQCGNAKNQIIILDKGQLIMCCYDVKGKYVYGNILESAFKDIWFSEDVKKRRKMARERKFPLCQKCDIC
ncbi:MAG: radical SAM protein [Patescibacteria group bacterium]